MEGNVARARRRQEKSKRVEAQQIVFSGVERVTLESARREFNLGPDDVLIQTQYSLVSVGTELAKLSGLEGVEYPFAPGNRAIGKVIALGEDVADARIGDIVFCHTPHVSHTLAKRLRIRVPPEVDIRASALVGLALVAMTALRVGQVELGDRVAVIGLGLVGNLAAQLLQLAGADVIVIDLNAGRLAKAQACGLTQGINPREDDTQAAVMELTRGQGVDIVVEASGTAQAAELAVSLTGRSGEGIVVLLGSPRQGYETDLTRFLNHVHLWRNGSVTLRGAHEWRYPLQHSPFQKHSMARNAEIIFRLMAQDKLRTKPLITHILKPTAAAEAFAGLRNKPDTYMGVLFDWTGRAQGARLL